MLQSTRAASPPGDRHLRPQSSAFPIAVSARSPQVISGVNHTGLGGQNYAISDLSWEGQEVLASNLCNFFSDAATQEAIQAREPTSLDAPADAPRPQPPSRLATGDPSRRAEPVEHVQLARAEASNRCSLRPLSSLALLTAGGSNEKVSLGLEGAPHRNYHARMARAAASQRLLRHFAAAPAPCPQPRTHHQSASHSLTNRHRELIFGNSLRFVHIVRDVRTIHPGHIQDLNLFQARRCGSPDRLCGKN